MLWALVVLVYGIFYMPSTTDTNVFTPVSRGLNSFLGGTLRKRVGS